MFTGRTVLDRMKFCTSGPRAFRLTLCCPGYCQKAPLRVPTSIQFWIQKDGTGRLHRPLHWLMSTFAAASLERVIASLDLNGAFTMISRDHVALPCLVCFESFVRLSYLAGLSNTGRRPI